VVDGQASGEGDFFLAQGFRRFSLRGHAKVSLEWNLVCLAYNLKRLHIVGAKLRAA
jgi:hypothetical protein